MLKIINEITGSGSIAAVPMGSGSMMRRDKVADREWVSDIQKRKETQKPTLSNDNNARHLKTQEQLQKAKELLAKRKKIGFKDFAKRLFNSRINEDFDMNNIVSRLKGLEARNAPNRTETTTYGVEDESGNIMKITVKNDQAKNFEARLALEMGEMENGKLNGFQNINISLAELLFNLKNEFEIVDVEFPEIPSDVIYNADKASYGMNTNSNLPVNNNSNNEFADSELDDGNNDFTGEPDFDLEQADELDDDFSDAENVEDFEDVEIEDNPEESLYKELIKMLTKQAEANKAEAEAEAEKARAMQAEYSARSANIELSRQEELARMEAEIDRKKNKEKEIKKMADLAKYRVQSNMPAFEGYTTLMKDVMVHLFNEEDSTIGNIETEQMVRNQMTAVKTRYAVLPTDDPATANYKRQMLATSIAELNAKMKKARLAVTRERELKNASNTAQTVDRREQQQTIDKSL